VGSRRPFRYLDSAGKRITDAAVVERLDGLAIPPAWREVRIAPGPRAKVQATGLDTDVRVAVQVAELPLQRIVLLLNRRDLDSHLLGLLGDLPVGIHLPADLHRQDGADHQQHGEPGHAAA